MRPNHLRLYCGPEDAATATGLQPALGIAECQNHRQTVTVPLMEVMPLVADAVRSERTWLRDFEDDEVTISADLYEVLLAYRHHRRPSA
jgi:hypothetical protein